jgi:hypothetical protein
MMIDLTDDESLVLFELLARYDSQDDDRQLKISHAAERNVLWSLLDVRTGVYSSKTRRGATPP